MWMLLGLISLMMAGGVADAFLRVDSNGNSFSDDEPDAQHGGPGGEGEGSDGDMLDYLNPDEPPVDDDERPGEAGDETGRVNFSEVGDLSEDNPPEEDAPEGDDWAGEWEDDEFISDDQPEPAPEPRQLRLGDEGGHLVGGNGDDTLIGGAGDDTLHAGRGNNQLYGGGGNDTLHGGPGDDTLTGGAGDDVLFSGGGRSVLLGGDGNDLMTGGEHDDTLFGGAGDDTLLGGWGDDLLVAGEGSNLLNGGAGNDTLIGVHFDSNDADISGVNYLNGGEGDDLIVLGSGDIATGGSGADTFVLGDWLGSAAPAVIVDFTPGEDRLIIAYDGTSLNDPGIAVAYDPATGSSQILLDGEVIAVLQGITELAPELIELQPIHPELANAPPPRDS